MVPRRQCLSGTERSWSGPAATSLPDGGIRAAQTAIHAAASRSLRNSTVEDNTGQQLSALGLTTWTGRRLSTSVAQCLSNTQDHKA
ncbi:uncharacterized [Lates japonicus]